MAHSQKVHGVTADGKHTLCGRYISSVIRYSNGALDLGWASNGTCLRLADKNCPVGVKTVPTCSKCLAAK